ncbi:unnamed protein product [Ambrosiozyma monospora]|uniref:Unnamed protein product n=1 Tax=Ambrosiozyma monospora TaxID=43982 RepID=A0A9W6Z1M8_AMBMO|nr:unnamed protein product [Ambrosiozyma monospora]
MTDIIRKSAPIKLTSLTIEEIPSSAAVVASGHRYHGPPAIQEQVQLETEKTTPHSTNLESQELEPTTSSQSDILDDDGFEYPENNLQGWLVVFGAFFGLLPTWGIPNSIGVIQTQVLEHQLSNVSTTTVSWIFSIYTCLTMSCAIFSGTYFDRNGSRVPMLIGTIMSVGSLLALANCTKVYQFILSFGVGFGAGSAIIMAPAIGAVSHYFPKSQRATAIAVAGSGGCVGGFLFPAMLRKSYQSLGFAWSMRCVAFLDLFCLVIALIFVKERKLSERQEMTTMEKAKLYLFKSFDFKAIVTDKRYLFNVLGCVFAETSIVITGSYFSFITVKNGFSESEAFLFVTVLNVFAVAGRYASGILADKWLGTYNIIIFLEVVVAISNLVIWMPFKSNRVALWIYSVIYGTFYGGIYSLVPSCCSQIVRVDTFGSRYATQYMVAGLCFLAFTPASSALIGDGMDNARNDGFIIFMSLISFLGATFYFLARTITVGFTLKKF